MSVKSKSSKSAKIEFIVSACLAGEECRYDCRAKTNEKIVKLVQEGRAISVCPEQLGGLSTPRPPAELQKDGKILTNTGQDVTQEYDAGAKSAWDLVRNHPIKKAFLKSRSPMCGFNKIYDGTFKGQLTDGDGVYTAILKSKGIIIESID